MILKNRKITKTSFFSFRSHRFQFQNNDDDFFKVVHSELDLVKDLGKVKDMDNKHVRIFWGYDDEVAPSIWTKGGTANRMKGVWYVAEGDGEVYVEYHHQFRAFLSTNVIAHYNHAKGREWKEYEDIIFDDVKEKFVHEEGLAMVHDTRKGQKVDDYLQANIKGKAKEKVDDFLYNGLQVSNWVSDNHYKVEPDGILETLRRNKKGNIIKEVIEIENQIDNPKYLQFKLYKLYLKNYAIHLIVDDHDYYKALDAIEELLFMKHFWKDERFIKKFNKLVIYKTSEFLEQGYKAGLKIDQVTKV